MAEGANAAASGALGIGLPTLMWTLDRLGADIPKPIVQVILGVSVLLIVVSLFLWGHLFIKWLRRKRGPRNEGSVAASGPQPMPMLDFMRLAQQRGWRVTGQHNLEAVDLMDGLRQAGSDGAIRFWGRRKEDRVVSEIPRDHWREYEFDWTSVTSATQNVATRTYTLRRPDARYEGGYADIHLDRATAPNWLETGAPIFRGQRDQRGTSRP